MNRHFRDARYHARRTAEELAAGLEMELEPVRERVGARIDEYRGVEEPEPEPTRTERVRRVGSNARDRLGGMPISR
ncbi:hypothetical protein [Haloarchaeobius iranensis]|uniref:Uncharacterized protein n=1 Tax=Haloarchaeobius iranensis TaxID=996166 RepID=A0A1G9XXR1_9EURY|nr:hypothetical protein [Haloarchaeobius iranensis]SDN01622.1 hypothetical protein SAMN05192554_11235 [Haloarchaeobius iranensis]